LPNYLLTNLVGCDDDDDDDHEG